MCLRSIKTKHYSCSAYLSSVSLAITLTCTLNRLSSFQNLRGKGGKFDHRPERPKVLLRHCIERTNCIFVFSIFYLAAFKRHYALAIAPELFYCSYMCSFMCMLWVAEIKYVYVCMFSGGGAYAWSSSIYFSERNQHRVRDTSVYCLNCLYSPWSRFVLILFKLHEIS